MGLLSFADGGEGEEEEPVVFKKKPMVRPDRELSYTPRLSCFPDTNIRTFLVVDPGEDVTSIPAPPPSSSKRTRDDAAASSAAPASSKAEGSSKKDNAASILELRERHEKEKSSGRFVYFHFTSTRHFILTVRHSIYIQYRTTSRDC